MQTLVAATDDGGVVLGILWSSATHPPVLSDVCSAPDIAKKVAKPGFQMNALPEKERAKIITHAKKCKPCRKLLCWGEL